MGNGGKVTDEVRVGSAVTGDDVQCSDLDGVAVWEWERGGDGCNFICSKGFSSSCGQTSCRKYSSACWVKRVVMAISGRISGGGRAVAHQGIHSEVAKHNCDAHLQLAHIWNIHRVVKDAGMQQLHDMVGSRLGTGGKVTWRVVWFKNNCEEVGALIHTTWCPNVQVVEI